MVTGRRTGARSGRSTSRSEWVSSPRCCCRRWCCGTARRAATATTRSNTGSACCRAAAAPRWAGPRCSSPGLSFLAAGTGIVRLGADASRGARARVATGWSVGCLGAALVLAFAFPIDPVPTYPVGSPSAPMSPSGFVHAVAGCAVVASAAACWFGGRAVAARWARRVSLAVCAVVAACSVCTLVGAVLHGGVWEHARAGLYQRISVFSALVWIAVLGLAIVRDDVAGRGVARPSEGRAAPTWSWTAPRRDQRDEVIPPWAAPPPPRGRSSPSCRRPGSRSRAPGSR
jgi:hypothetical protein